MPVGLVLGGGAPNLPLMSGALLALEEAGVEFEVISTTGAGMLAGLLYASPRKLAGETTIKEARERALRATSYMGIDDLLYLFMPINFKVFQKPGPVAEAMAPHFNRLFSAPRDTAQQRLMADWMALVSATWMPSNLSLWSKGLCQPPSWIEDLVDFKDLVPNLGSTRFRMGAYSIEDGADITFHRDEITIDHCKAALAMPFIYEPYKLKNKQTGEEKTYLEGSAFAPLSLDPQDVMVEHDIDTIIFFDILGHRRLNDEPRDLIDAWVQSIIAPLTRLAENNLAAFKEKRARHARERFIQALDDASDLAETEPKKFIAARDQIREEQAFLTLVDLLGSADVDRAGFIADAKDYLSSHNDPKLQELVALVEAKRYAEFVQSREAYLKSREVKPSAPDLKLKTQSIRSELLRMPFRLYMEDEDWRKVLDWSHSNMSRLFEVGLETGRDFVRNHRKRLESSMKKKLTI